MSEVPEVVLILVQSIVAPVAVWLLQAVKQATGWRGPRMAKAAAVLSFVGGAALALVLGLASVGEILSPLQLVGAGGITSAIAGAIYSTLKDRMGWSNLPGGPS